MPNIDMPRPIPDYLSNRDIGDETDSHSRQEDLRLMEEAALNSLCYSERQDITRMFLTFLGNIAMELKALE